MKLSPLTAVLLVALGMLFIGLNSVCIIPAEGPLAEATRNVNHARNIWLACDLYLSEHHGERPEELTMLEGDYLDSGQLQELSFRSRFRELPGTDDWTYLKPEVEHPDPPQVVLRSPTEFTRYKVFVYSDGSRQIQLKRWFKRWKKINM